jgi:hypothetical protein
LAATSQLIARRPGAGLAGFLTTPAAWWAVGLIDLTVGWLVYVFRGSQAGYVLAVVATVALAAALAWQRRRLVVILLLGEIALVGTEANGLLAAGTAPLGSLRMVDATAMAALLALAARGLWRIRERGGSVPATLAHIARRGPPVLVSRAPGAALLLGAVFVAVGLWAINGSPMDGIVRSDLRVLGLGVATWTLAVTCRNWPPRDFALALASLGVLVAIKATAIYLSDLYVIGNYDRLQASLVGGDLRRRIILIGGDTLLILAPAMALLALTTQPRRVRLWLGVCLAAALLGLFISSTRTGFIVAVALLAATGGGELIRRSGSLSARRVLAAGAVLAALLATGSLASGRFDRLTTADAPHTGFNFRVDEARTFIHLSPLDVALGQGLGGRFMSRDTFHEPTITGWSHVLPVWIGLKLGFVGIIAAAFALVLLGRRALALVGAGGQAGRDAALGCVLVAGLVLMSLGIGRAALPEGAALLGFGIALLPARPREPL